MTAFVSGVGGPLILQVYEFFGGPLIDLDATPTIEIVNLGNGVTVVGPTATGVTHPSTGTYLYNWTAPVSGGLYQAIWMGTLAVSGYSANEIFTVYSPSNVTVGPCDGWNIDTGCCDDWDTLSPSLRAAATAYATTVLWAATGRRFGLCTKTVRPCGRQCMNEGQLAGGWYWSEGTWLPYIFNGVWRNCWCGCNGTPGCCGCQVDCQVYLPGPVNSIIEVTLDGEVVDPATYRVDNGIWLVRTRASADEADPPCWPLFQNFNLDSGQDTLIVSYLKGLAVPAPLLRAAGELACEYVKACQGLPCRLPARATSIARQGVVVSMVDVDTLLEKGLTGVTTVDQIIRTYNPGGIASAMRIATPDAVQIRETTWP